MDAEERILVAGLCRRNALHVLRLAWSTHPEVGFDAAGVRWLHHYIEAAQHHLPHDYLEEFVQLMGCFYGECLRTTLGGSWDWSGNQLGIYLSPYGFTYPCAAVAKRLKCGEPASLVTAFSVAVEHLAANAA